MPRPRLGTAGLASACATLCLSLVLPAVAAPTLAYDRDAALFLKQRQAAEARQPGVFLARKRAAMSDSAIGFFRGSAPLFYRDVAEHGHLRAPVVIPIAGDLHLENVSAFTTASGRVTFDLDDFDEAVSAPYTWELARVLVSVRLHAREANLSSAASERLVKRFLKTYMDRLAAVTRSPELLTAPLTARLVPGPAAEAMAKAARGRRGELIAHFASGGRLKLGRKVKALDLGTARGITLAVEAYAARRSEPEGFFRVKDVARRMAGLASLSRQRYLVLVEGPTAADGDDLLLDLKAAGPPAAVPWVPAVPGSQAERVRKAWLHFVPDADRYLGLAPAGGGDLLVRELAPGRAEVRVGALSEARFTQFLDAVALVTARAHARSGKGAALLGDAESPETLHRELAPFSEAYARQVEADREIWKTYMDP